tara:strand:+ start:12368 stop:13210 length:843 start_codon:yes stop_codon:yes gene_type:complete
MSTENSSDPPKILGLDVPLDDYDVPPEEDYDTSVVIPDDYMSASRLGKYLKCGEDFRRTYVLKQGYVSNAPMALGRTVHSLVETTLKQKMRGGDLRSVEEAFDEAATLTAAEFSEVEGLEEPVESWTDEARRLYQTWHTMRAPFIKPVAVEERFTANVNGIKTVGVIDLIDDQESGLELIDLKVVKRKKSMKDVKESLQLGIYGHVKGIPTVGFDSLVKGAVPKVERVVDILEPRETRWAAALLRETAELISAGVFSKTSPDNWWCSDRFCSWWSDCRGK